MQRNPADASGSGLLPLLPVITPRLCLRQFYLNDHSAVYQLHRDRAVTRFAGGSKTRKESLATLERMIERVSRTGFGPFAVTERKESSATQPPIGWCGVQPLRGTNHYEVLYAFATEFWGNGYATEAAGAIMHAAFSSPNLPTDELVGLVYPQNIASIRVLEKVGMQFREYIYDETTRRHACLYACKRSAFFSAYAALMTS